MHHSKLSLTVLAFGSLAMKGGCGNLDYYNMPVDVVPSDAVTDTTIPRDVVAAPDAIVIPPADVFVSQPDAALDAPADAPTDGPLDAVAPTINHIVTCALDGGSVDAGTVTAPDGGSSYACLGCVHFTDPVTATRDVRVRISDFLSRTGIADLTVKACARSDATCATPIATGTTDSLGYVGVTLPLGEHGFDGFVEVTSQPGSANPVFPSLFTFSQPVTSGVGTYSTYLFAFSPAEANLLAGMVRTTLDPTRGHITFSLNDCAYGSAIGASLYVAGGDARTHTYYARGLALSTTATDTDDTGVGATLNVPPGTYTLTSYRSSDHEFIGTIDVPVRQGFATAVVLTPTPDVVQ